MACIYLQKYHYNWNRYFTVAKGSGSHLFFGGGGWGEKGGSTQLLVMHWASYYWKVVNWQSLPVPCQDDLAMESTSN